MYMMELASGEAIPLPLLTQVVTVMGIVVWVSIVAIIQGYPIIPAQGTITGSPTFFQIAISSRIILARRLERGGYISMSPTVIQCPIMYVLKTMTGISISSVRTIIALQPISVHPRRTMESVSTMLTTTPFT